MANYQAGDNLALDTTFIRVWCAQYDTTRNELFGGNTIYAAAGRPANVSLQTVSRIAARMAAHLKSIGEPVPEDLPMRLLTYMPADAAQN